MTKIYGIWIHGMVKNGRDNTELEKKRVSNWDDDGFRGKFFIHNHSFYESRYAIGDLCAYGNPGYYYQVNISIHEYGSEIPVVYSGEQCLPSSYGIVEFDISNSNIGYVVSGTGSQGVVLVRDKMHSITGQMQG